MSSTVVVGVLLLVIGIILMVVGAFAMILLRFIGSPFLTLGLILMVLGITFMAGRGWSGRRTLPPPPPIQQPMVPAGMQGAVSLNCPNCGGTPGLVDRFGIATCSHCQNRFLVR